jgi:hypothetical protein
VSATPGITCMSVLGAPGTGKTTLLDTRLVGVRRALILDPYDALKADTACETVADALRAAREAGDTYRIRVCLADPDDGDANPVEALAGQALEDGAVLVVDEAHEYLSTHRLARSAARGGAPSALRLVRQGRHHGAALWIASQRPAAVARDLTANSERYLFRLDEAVDLRYVAASSGREVAQAVRALPDYHAFHVLRGVTRRVKLEEGPPPKVVDAVRQRPLPGV